MSELPGRLAGIQGDRHLELRQKKKISQKAQLITQLGAIDFISVCFFWFFYFIFS